MLAPEDRQPIHALLLDHWPRSTQLDHYADQAVSTANRLGVSVEQILDAIQEHHLDTTERLDGYLVGQWPPDPSNLKSQLEAGAERERRERKAEDVARQMKQQRAADKSKGDMVPNMPSGVVEWVKLVSKNASHTKFGSAPLNAREQQRYQELSAYWAKQPERQPA